MISIDSLFLKIFHSFLLTPTYDIDKKDKRILSSLYKQLQQGAFLTENQARLLVKILKENNHTYEKDFPDAKDILDCNLWSEKFRIIEKTRKIFWDPKKSETFFIEFNFDKKLKEKISLLNSSIDGSIVTVGKIHSLDLTEKNLFAAINLFSKDRFDIDEKLLKFYREIEKIKDEFSNPYEIFSLTNEKMKSVIENDIGSISLDNLFLLHDRKFRYQYQIFEKIHEKSLTAKIASREKTKIFINKNKCSLKEIFSRLSKIKRL